MKPKTTKLHTTGPLSILKCTQMAVQVQDEDGEKFWVPFSQIREPDDSEIRQAEGTDMQMEITIPEWIAKEKGMI